MKWRLLRGNTFTYEEIPLHFMLDPVQYREYEYSLFVLVSKFSHKLMLRCRVTLSNALSSTDVFPVHDCGSAVLPDFGRVLATDV